MLWTRIPIRNYHSLGGLLQIEICLLTSSGANVTRVIRPVKGIELQLLATNMFVIKFEHRLERKKAMKGFPWVLDKYALILEPIDPNRKHEYHSMLKLPIMIRVLQLSLANRSNIWPNSLETAWGLLWIFQSRKTVSTALSFVSRS